MYITTVRVTDWRGQAYCAVNELPNMEDIDMPKHEMEHFTKEFEDYVNTGKLNGPRMVNAKRSKLLLTKREGDPGQVKLLGEAIARSIAKHMVGVAGYKFVSAKKALLYLVVNGHYAKDSAIIKDVFKDLGIDFTFKAMQIFLLNKENN